MKPQKIIINLIICLFIGVIVAYAGGQGGQTYGGWSIYAIVVGFAFLANWLAFIPAYIFQTEKFFDLVGSLTYIVSIIITLKLSENIDTRSMLLAGLVIIWAVRLGSFLVIRITQDGKDERFDKIKPNFLRFFQVWTIQAIWVTLTASAAIIGITSTLRKEIGYFAMAGFIIWVIGFLFEVVADYQKRQFRKNPANKGQFIRNGLWSKSRHPNYFGEITLWIGVFIIAIPILQGWQWIALLSPVFVVLLLTRVSGLPALESKADRKWGGQPEYEKYKANTPILIPKI